MMLYQVIIAVFFDGDEDKYEAHDLPVAINGMDFSELDIWRAGRIAKSLGYSSTIEFLQKIQSKFPQEFICE